MKVPEPAFTLTDRSEVPATRHPAEAWRRTFRIGDPRVRRVEYSPGRLADRTCDRGHVPLVLEGEPTTEPRDGRRFTPAAGTSCRTSDFADAAHRSATVGGAKIFIVD